jgi:siroheme synthase-like protein
MGGFTVNLQVRGWRCLVIGAGAIALPKALRLVEAGAVVTLVDPAAPEALPGATLIRRKAELSDLDGMRLAILGTDDPDLNRRFQHEAARRGILSAAVDDLEAADFYMPAVLRRGDLEIAVSSGGKSPAFTVWVRDRLETLLDDSYGQALDWFDMLRRKRLRAWLLSERRRAFKALLAMDFLAYFREGRIAAWEAKAEQALRDVREA